MRIWNFEQENTVRELLADQPVRDLAWSPDGDLLAGTDEKLKIWDLSTGDLVLESEHLCLALAWHPDGSQLAFFSIENWSLLRRSDWTVTRVQDHFAADAGDIAWSPDGTRLAVAYAEVVTIWDSIGEEPPVTLRGHLRPLRSVDWSPDGAKLVTSDALEETKIWDWRASLQPPPISTGTPIEELAWTDDGSSLVSISQNDHAVSLWDHQSGALVKKKLPELEGTVHWSPGLQLIAVRGGSGEEPEIRVLDASTHAVRSIWHGRAGHRLRKVVWSPNAARLAIGTTFDRHLSVSRCGMLIASS